MNANAHPSQSERAETRKQSSPTPRIAAAIARAGRDIGMAYCEVRDEGQRLERELAWAQLTLATINDMVLGEDGERGDEATLRAVRALLNERDELRARLLSA